MKTPTILMLPFLMAAMFAVLTAHAETTNTASRVGPVTATNLTQLASPQSTNNVPRVVQVELKREEATFPMQKHMEYSSDDSTVGRKLGRDIFTFSCLKKRSMVLGVSVVSEYPLQVGPDRDSIMVAARLSWKLK